MDATRVTAAMVRDVSQYLMGVIITDDSVSGFRALTRLSRSDADNPSVVVLFDHTEVTDMLGEYPTPGAVAQAMNADIRSRVAAGLL